MLLVLNCYNHIQDHPLQVSNPPSLSLAVLSNHLTLNTLSCLDAISIWSAAI